MKQFVLIGHPLGHSFSPWIHERLFSLSHLSASYRALPVLPADLPAFFENIGQYDGVNVTIPHKQAVIPFCRTLDPSAKHGAVNVIKTGSLTGYNTDGAGFLASIGPNKISGRVLVAGAGGAARALAATALSKGAFVTLAVRESSYQKGLDAAADLAKLYPNGQSTAKTYIQIQQDPGRFDWLIHATPVGMWPDTGAALFEQDFLKRCDNVFDAVYNPAETTLLSRAKKAGCQTYDGVGMLVWQAALSHRIWYGAEFSPVEIGGIIQKLKAVLAG